MKDDLTNLRLALNSIQRAATNPPNSGLSEDVDGAIQALDRLELRTRAYAALYRGLAEPSSKQVVAQTFLSFFTFVRQDIGLGEDPLRDRPIYTVLDELYATAKELRNAR